ncbi:hypothetical protein HRG_001026 [Hirsutella rhossiliensis]|uniref:Aminoglycoside phosphotransferase domain-containing protein n=1 Tax=Hirsutella rhossiliensis TaxID=111463 RepID=A0A9P8N9U7_9HYPO|nr:uncharacterized protein HRG_01026 [Hirsutella rhossiliensis]KAH0968384.1 hypothetical protein HRG_01026 [Hirsutella rhossiliensis]
MMQVRHYCSKLSAINRFFSGHQSPSQMQCDEIARAVSGASTVRPVISPGSMSHTVICNERPGPQEDLIVSFREPGARLDGQMVELAKGIHGDLVVPESTCLGNVEGADPPLSIYLMPYLQGSSCIEVLAFQVEMDPEEEARHGVFVKHLARYFGRSRLNESLPLLFSQDYPQVLTHGDFSLTNILVDENEFGTTGIVNWSPAAAMPFGMELDILFLITGFMTKDGWYDYRCTQLLQETFWEEFWVVTGTEGGERRGRIRRLAEAAAQIGAILRLAFRRNADGSPSEDVLALESRMEQLRTWFGLRGVD